MEKASLGEFLLEGKGLGSEHQIERAELAIFVKAKFWKLENNMSLQQNIMPTLLSLT